MTGRMPSRTDPTDKATYECPQCGMRIRMHFSERGLFEGVLLRKGKRIEPSGDPSYQLSERNQFLVFLVVLLFLAGLGFLVLMHTT